jgi:hypothetical protein
LPDLRCCRTHFIRRWVQSNTQRPMSMNMILTVQSQSISMCYFKLWATWKKGKASSRSQSYGLDREAD